jgi:hypothetical protein
MLRIVSKYFFPPFAKKESKLATSPKLFPLQPNVSNKWRERKKCFPTEYFFLFYIQCQEHRGFPQSNSFIPASNVERGSLALR